MSILALLPFFVLLGLFLLISFSLLALDFLKNKPKWWELLYFIPVLLLVFAIGLYLSNPIKNDQNLALATIFFFITAPVIYFRLYRTRFRKVQSYKRRLSWWTVIVSLLFLALGIGLLIWGFMSLALMSLAL